MLKWMWIWKHSDQYKAAWQHGGRNQEQKCALRGLPIFQVSFLKHGWKQFTKLSSGWPRRKTKVQAPLHISQAACLETGKALDQETAICLSVLGVRSVLISETEQSKASSLLLVIFPRKGHKFSGMKEQSPTPFPTGRAGNPGGKHRSGPGKAQEPVNPVLENAPKAPHIGPSSSWKSRTEHLRTGRNLQGVIINLIPFHFPDGETCPAHPACLVCIEAHYHSASGLSPALSSEFLLVLCSGPQYPSLIFVFLKTFALLDRSLQDTQRNRLLSFYHEAARASLMAPVKLSRVGSHWCSQVPSIVLPVYWGSFQFLPWPSVPGEERNPIWLLLWETEFKCIFTEHLSSVRCHAD